MASFMLKSVRMSCLLSSSGNQLAYGKLVLVGKFLLKLKILDNVNDNVKTMSRLAEKIKEMNEHEQCSLLQ